MLRPKLLYRSLRRQYGIDIPSAIFFPRGVPELNLKVKGAQEYNWQRIIRNYKYEPFSNKPKCYVLAMFPYPSGNLHMGHVRVYTISDTLAWFYRMNGYNVLHPIGFDAFGLPAENAAIQHNISPDVWTKRNIEKMKDQLIALNYNFDWAHEIVTCDPSYYKFTQYLFLLLHQAGLVYEKEALVNWDPVDKTVVANEQVDAHGVSWRSGAKIEKKLLKQWFVKTTAFSWDLWSGLKDPGLKGWKDVIKVQNHWIGLCNGVSYDFSVQGSKNLSKVQIWTAHPESVSRAQFVCVSPHSILSRQIDDNASSTLNIQVFNPFSGKYLPVHVTSELAYDDGQDIKLGIPAVDESVREFADKYGYKYTVHTYSGIESLEEISRLGQIASLSEVGGFPTSSKLQDWLVSRQRYWGTPIPIIHCPSCGPVPVPVCDLPITLPHQDAVAEWRFTSCPRCKGAAMRETDTLDTFFDSSWYFLRYLDPRNRDQPFSKAKANYGMPVDVYVGGKEHALLHLFYARFMTRFLNSLGLVNAKEPFTKLIAQGMVMAKTYTVKKTKKVIPKESTTEEGSIVIETKTGEEVDESWEKMSKSKYNGVDPSQVLEENGSDTTRLMILSQAAPTSNIHWESKAFPGISNFQTKVFKMVHNFVKVRKDMKEPIDLTETTSEIDKKLKDARNFYTKGATFNYRESQQFNVVVTKLQGFAGTLAKVDSHTMGHSKEFERGLATLLVLLTPMTPFFCSDLWSLFTSAPHRRDPTNDHIVWDKFAVEQGWPKLDEDYPLDIHFKVNNAVKSSIKMSAGAFKDFDHEQAMSMALSDTNVINFLEGRKVKNSTFEYIPEYAASLNLLVNVIRKPRNKKSV